MNFIYINEKNDMISVYVSSIAQQYFILKQFYIFYIPTPMLGGQENLSVDIRYMRSSNHGACVF